MTGVIVRKLIRLLMTMAVLASVTAAPAEAKPRVIRGGFTATATPFPNPWESVPGMNGCASGTEGMHKVSHSFKAPFDGWFHVKLSFEGDWDLYLTDDQGFPIAESYAGKILYGLPRASATIDHFLAAGEEILIVACNWSGSLEAEVRYAHRAARAWPGAPSGEMSHEESQTYRLPAAATSENYVLCWYSAWGCNLFDVWGKDRSVSVEIVDTVAKSVAFKIYQYRIESTRFVGKNYCGSTKKPVEIEPSADVVVVMILTGPCEGDSTFHVPTTGTIRAEFTR